MGRRANLRSRKLPNLGSCSRSLNRATLLSLSDGNGRWARKRDLPRLAGHKAGVNALRRVVQFATDEQIEMLSVYAFSTESWGRPRVEVDGLMRLFWETRSARTWNKLHRDGVRLRHLGRLEDLLADIRAGSA